MDNPRGAVLEPVDRSLAPNRYASPVTSLPVFYINLDARTDRRSFMEPQFAALGVAAERISAVRSDEVPQDLLDIHANPAHPWPIAAGEIACGLSHQKCWLALIECGAPAAIVLEDDVMLAPGFVEFVDSSVLDGLDADVIKLETFRSPIWMIGEARRRGTHFTLERLISVHLGTAAYLISRHCAEISLADPRLREVAIDRFLFGPGGPRLFGSTVLQAIPSPCIQVTRIAGFEDKSIWMSDLVAARRARPGRGKRRWQRRVLRALSDVGYRAELFLRLALHPRTFRRGRRRIGFAGDSS